MEYPDYYRFGEKCLGPLLYGFSKWLLLELEKKGLTKVYFFSRDGFIMKRAFDIVNKNHAIKSFYLEVSRRSLRVPVLRKNYSLENISTMISPSMQISVDSIFDAVGLDIDNYDYLLSKYRLAKGGRILRSKLLEDKNIKKLYNELSPEIERISEQEYAVLKKYILQNDLKGSFAIVDIGWSGGMQRFLASTLNDMGIDATIYGFYTGVCDYYKRNIDEKHPLYLNGYLFDFSHDEFAKDSRSAFVGLYEILFLERKGSVEKYSKGEDGSVIALRYPYEYEENGVLMPEVGKIQAVQEGAINRVIRDNEASVIPLTPKEQFDSLYKSGARPTREAVRLFADFHFFDEGMTYCLAKPKSLVYYIFHLYEFKKDFLDSRWKTAFLRRLLGLPISYLWLYNGLKKISK